jgi:MFS family permease
MSGQAGFRTGLRAFVIVWIGQLVSVLATQMTQFSLTIWAYEKTGSATALGLVSAFYITPFLIAAPVAGALVDRYDRKKMMMVSDLGAGLATVIVFCLQATGSLQVWHLYGTAMITGVAQAFQWPAYSAAISTLVPKEQYGRANGLMSLIETGPGVLAPVLAGSLLPFIGLAGILMIDVATFVLAIGALLLIEVPPPAESAEGVTAKQGSMWQEVAYGFRYILARPSLLGLQLIFLAGNLCVGLGFTVLAPMILTRTANNASLYGVVQSAGAIGGILGGLVMSVWGGFKRRVHGVLLGWIALSLLGEFWLGLGRELIMWIPAMFLCVALTPLIDGSNQAIWQAKVAPDVQGRVFSARQMIAVLATPLAPLIAGPLADIVLEPGMRNGVLTPLFGWLVGNGPGAGMALVLVGAGLLGALVGLSGYLVPAIRKAEELLPDYTAPASEEAPS